MSDKLTSSVPNIECCPTCSGTGMIVDINGLERTCPSGGGRGYLEGRPYDDRLD